MSNDQTKPSNPEFPANRHHLVNGSYIVCCHPAVVEQLGIPLDQPIVVGWTGRYVRFGEFTWDVEQLCQEIDEGYWQVPGRVLDFADPEKAMLFDTFCSPSLDG